MRLSPGTGKQDCHVIDFVDSTNRIVGIINAPTLFGLDPTIVLDGAPHSLTWLIDTLILSLDASIQELEAHADAIKEKLTIDIPDRLSVPDPKSVTYIDYDNPFVLVNQSTGMPSPHVLQLSRNAWVDCGEGIHVLECLGKGHIRIEPVTGGEQSRNQKAISV
jgi:ATP-dependent helicase IRC3